MTYKYAFEKLGFSPKIESDFGFLVSNGVHSFLIYSSRSCIQCFSLDYFQNMSKEDISFLFNLSFDNEDNGNEEYHFDNDVNRDDFLRFIFNCQPGSADVYQENYFKRIDHKNNALLLKNSNTIDKLGKSKVVNFIAFDEKANCLQFNNTSCLFIGDNITSSKQCYIFWNANALLEYKKNLFGTEYTTFLFPLRADNRTIKIPLTVPFSEYFLCYSCVADQIEILRFVLQFLMVETSRMWVLGENGAKIQIETQFFSRDEVISWAQFIADIRKNIRDRCFNGEKKDFEFIYDENLTIGDIKYYYISLVPSPKLISIFTDKLLNKYNLSNRIHISTHQL